MKRALNLTSHMRLRWRWLWLACLAQPQTASSHTHDAYSRQDRAVHANPAWMARLPGELSIANISIPGTHNSMSLHGGDHVATQTLPLAEQLRAGIRAFDIRLKVVYNELRAYHGSFGQNATFVDILGTMVKFLRENPTETLIVRIKEEGPPLASNVSFADAVATARSPYEGYIHPWTMRPPPLQAVRGKLIMIRDGIYSQLFSVTDMWYLPTNWSLYSKWEDIKAALAYASVGWSREREGGPGARWGHVVYLSANGGSFPYFVASGHTSNGEHAARLATGLTTPAFTSYYPDFPRVNCAIGICTIAFEGMNVLMHDYIKVVRPAYVGTVMADFPGPALIRTIIETNLPVCRQWQQNGNSSRGTIYVYRNPQSGTTDYFARRTNGRYGYFPTNRASNAEWQFLGHDAWCK